MADDPNLKIGISLDTSQLPDDVQKVESELQSALEGVTSAVEDQQAAAEDAAKAHTEGAAAATAAQLQTARAVEDTTKALERQQRGADDTANKVGSSIKATTSSASAAVSKMSKESAAASGSVSKSISQGTQAVGGFTKALNVANGVMGILTKGFAVVGLINQVAASMQLIADWYAKISQKAEDAAQKVRDSWAAQREEAQRLKRQNAAVDALNEQIAGHERLLALMREEASHEAQMRGMRARAEGNMEEAEKATLDGMLARGEISEYEHIDRTRAIEDKSTARRQANEMASARDDLNDAVATQEARQQEASSAKDKLNNLLLTGMRVGLVNEGLADTNYMQHMSEVWANRNQIINNHGGDTGRYADGLLYRYIQERDQAAQAVYAAAKELGVATTTKNEEGKEETRSVDELARAVQEEWTRQRRELKDKANDASEQEAAASRSVTEKQDILTAKQREHETEDAAIQERRQQEDLTLAYRANEEAVKASTAAAKAEAAARRAEQEQELEVRASNATQQAAAARASYDNAWQMEQERAEGYQAEGMAAISRLLARAEREPQVLAQLRAAVTGGEVTMTEDEARRYGADIRSVKAAGLTPEQQAGLIAVADRLKDAMTAEAASQAAAEAVSRYRGERADEARAATRQNVDQLRSDAATASARADEAGARTAAPPTTQPQATTMPQAAAMPPVDDALRQAGDVIRQHNDLASRTGDAMEQFNSTAQAAAAALSSQQERLNRLAAENAALRQQITTIARANV